MSANLYEKRMVTHKTPAWHDYEGAYVFPDWRIGLEEAGRQAGLTFRCSLQPLYSTPPGWTEQADGLVAPSRPPLVAVPNRVALWREATPKMAGLGRVAFDEDGRVIMSPAQYLTDVSPTYPIWQNEDILRALDPISRRWPVESVGALEDGAVLLMSLNMGGADHAGEQYTNLFGLIENRRGSCLVAMFTKVRMVCANTAIAALQEAHFIIRVPHGPRFLQEADAALKLMSRAEKVQEEFDDLAESLIREPLAMQEAREIVRLLWPEPAEPTLSQQERAVAKIGVETQDLAEVVNRKRREWEVARLRQERHQLLAIECYDRLVGTPISGTAWGLYQAVVETADHEKGRGDRAYSALAGERAKVKEAALGILSDRLN